MKLPPALAGASVEARTRPRSAAYHRAGGNTRSGKLACLRACGSATAPLALPKGEPMPEKRIGGWHVAVAAEAVAASLFARCGLDVSVQYGANQPEYDLIVASGEKLLKVSVKGTTGSWLPFRRAEPRLQGARTLSESC